MGGDHAPDVIVRGAIDGLEFLAPDDELTLIGDESVIRDIAEESGVDDPRLRIVHATQTIEMGESPVEAVRSKPDSSLAKLAKMGSAKYGDERLDVIISAGNTGACVSAATMHMKRLLGVHRPGIACTLPTPAGPVVLCDVGANPEPRATHLAQYAVMAEAYAKMALGIERPRIAQLNIGSEEAKGTGMVKAVREMLGTLPGINYTGYIEGRDVFEGAADVIVTDGFVGNTMLKLAEGMARSFFKAIAQEVFEADMELAIKLGPVVEGLKKKNDYHEYGGAPLLGVNGGCIICHGSSERRTIKNAVRAACELVRSGVNQQIIERVAAIDEMAGRGALAD